MPVKDSLTFVNVGTGKIHMGGKLRGREGSLPEDRLFMPGFQVAAVQGVPEVQKRKQPRLAIKLFLHLSPE